MSNLTLRNLTPTPLKITRISRFPPPLSKPEPTTHKNTTDVSNIVGNITCLLRRVPAIITPSPKLPSAKQLAENAKAFEEKDVSIDIGSYTGQDTGLELDRIAVLRLEFETAHAAGPRKFRVDIVGDTIELPVHPRGDVGGSSLIAVFHRDKNHIALVPNTSLADWMGRLKDSTALGTLSMPGTHNSATHHVALPSVRCQAVGVAEQLKNGVRFLDIRAQPHGRELTLVHGAFPIALLGTKKLSDVMQECYQFLDAHKGEAIIISLKREGRGGTNDEEFSKLIKEEVVDRERDKWFVEPVIPTLERCRGRCILFRRYKLDESLKSEHGGKGYGIDAEIWEYNTPNTTTASGICIQDFCEVLETQNIGKKIQFVKDHLERSCTQLSMAARDQKDPPLFVNFLSASNFWRIGCWPDRIAAKINPVATEHLAVTHKVGGGGAGTGVVIMDFVGEGGNWAVFRLVVGMNGGLWM